MNEGVVSVRDSVGWVFYEEWWLVDGECEWVGWEELVVCFVVVGMECISRFFYFVENV